MKQIESIFLDGMLELEAPTTEVLQAWLAQQQNCTVRCSVDEYACEEALIAFHEALRLRGVLEQLTKVTDLSQMQELVRDALDTPQYIAKKK